jgi:hypothetical protein
MYGLSYEDQECLRQLGILDRSEARPAQSPSGSSESESADTDKLSQLEHDPPVPPKKGKSQKALKEQARRNDENAALDALRNCPLLAEYSSDLLQRMPRISLINLAVLCLTDLYRRRIELEYQRLSSPPAHFIPQGPMWVNDPYYGYEEPEHQPPQWRADDI